MVYWRWRGALESMCPTRYPRGIWWSMGLGRGVWDLAGDVGKYVAQTIFKNIVNYGGWRGCWKVCASYYTQGL